MDAAYVDAVVGDGAVLDVVEPVDEVRDGGLAGPRAAHEGHFLARVGREVDIEEYLPPLDVGEVHRVERYLAALRRQRRATLPRPASGACRRLVERVVDVDERHRGVLLGLRGLVEQGVDALGASHGVDDAVQLVRHLRHRLV